MSVVDGNLPRTRSFANAAEGGAGGATAFASITSVGTSASSASTSASASASSSSDNPSGNYGRFVYPDGAVYEGGFAVAAAGGARVKQGQGGFSDAHSSYTGAWDADRMHGKGSYVGASGATYEGDFVDNKFHGQGLYRWADGAEYRGSWSHSKMHGEGAYTAADGLQFVGVFYNGLYVSGNTHIAVR